MDDILELILPSQSRHLHDCSSEFSEAAGTVDVLLPDIRRHTVRLVFHQAKALVDRMKPILSGQLNDQVVWIKVFLTSKHRHRSHGAQQVIAHNIFFISHTRNAKQGCRVDQFTVRQPFANQVSILIHIQTNQSCRATVLYLLPFSKDSFYCIFWHRIVRVNTD